MARVAGSVRFREDLRVRVVVAGSSGLIGTSLVAHLRAAGHEVLRLVRRTPAAPDERGWDPPAGRIDDGTFDGVDAVVNLNGAGIADRPWSGARKQLLRDSRNVPTEVLAGAVADHGVGSLLNQSGINYYGDTGSRVVDETAPVGAGFLAEVCRDWEAATAPAVKAGARVVLLRSAAVLSPRGGVLGRLRPLFSLMLGGRIGTGQQAFPWISLDDQVGATQFLLEHPDVSGPVNLAGPEPATNAEFTAALAEVLRRPAPLAVPSFALKAVLGQMAEEMVLTGPLAVPAVLQRHGYQFRHVTVREALAAALER
ncbi:MAG: uncharacterized protein V7646_3817 [Pseudonocardia sp.]